MNSYFDSSNHCGNCDTTCKKSCTGSSPSQCSCNINYGQYWLRKDKSTRKTYCEYIPYIDFSILNDISIPVPSSITCESTLEFWLFVYSYNTGKNNFQKTSIIWDLHNAVEINVKNNGLNVICYPIYNHSQSEQYTEQINLTLGMYQWNMIRCGSNMASPERTFFFNTNTKSLTAECPNSRIGKSEPTALYIKSEANPHSFGFVFIKGIKL